MPSTSWICFDIILEYGFGSNSTAKTSSRGEGCPSLKYSNLALFLADVGLGFFLILPNSTRLPISNRSSQVCLTKEFLSDGLSKSRLMLLVYVAIYQYRMICDTIHMIRYDSSSWQYEPVS